jgi:hypothetical protein
MYINDIAEKLISLTRLFADATSFSYSNRDEFQTLSNALEKSQNTKQLISFFSSEFKMQLYTHHKQGLQEKLCKAKQECFLGPGDRLRLLSKLKI